MGACVHACVRVCVCVCVCVCVHVCMSYITHIFAPPIYLAISIYMCVHTLCPNSYNLISKKMAP